jgi:aminoglycoside phosphotransferase (APT) family kinase protein
VTRDVEPALDAEVAAWLADHALPGRRIERARTLSGGYRNHNLQLVTDSGEQFVLRRFLHANTCAIEAALAARLTGVAPVAEVIATDPQGSTAGQPVMLSRFMPGAPLSDALSTVDGDRARQLGHAVGATLAAIGTVTFSRPGVLVDPDPILDADGADPTAALPAFVERCLGNGNAHHHLTPAEHDALLRYASQHAPLLTAVSGSRQLVHSDFNPKNLLASHRNGTWTITAVLDWEFALSSTPLIDIGNMLRFQHELPPAFTAGFTAGFADFGGDLPDNWIQVSHALDLFALADFLTRPPDNPFFGKAVDLIRRRLHDTRDNQSSLANHPHGRPRLG